MFTLDPAADFAFGETCTVTVARGQRDRPGLERPAGHDGREPRLQLHRRPRRLPPPARSSSARSTAAAATAARRSRTTSSSSTTAPARRSASPAGRCSTRRRPARRWLVTPLGGSIPGRRQLPDPGGRGRRRHRSTCRRPTRPGSIAMSATAGKVALVSTTTAAHGGRARPAARSSTSSASALTANCFEGTGPAPAPSNTTSDLRNGGGATDTDNNAADFTAGAPDPHASADQAPIRLFDDARERRHRRGARRQHLDHLQRAGQRHRQLVHDRLRHAAVRTPPRRAAARPRSRSTRRRTSPPTSSAR